MYAYVNRQSGANAFYFISYAFKINLRETKKRDFSSRIEKKKHLKTSIVFIR